MRTTATIPTPPAAAPNRPAANAAAPQGFAWSAWPARQRPGRAIWAALTILAFAVLITAWCLFDGLHPGPSLAAGLGSLAVLFLALNRFFLPSRFEIDEKGLTAQHPLRLRRIEWKNVRRFLHDEHGGYLSRRAIASRFDSWQGVHLLWGVERKRALDTIRAHLEAASEESATKMRIERAMVAPNPSTGHS